MSTSAIDLRVHDLGVMDYAAALTEQRRRQAEVIDARARGGGPMHLLLVEHAPPVITVSRRPGARRHLVATPAALAAAGVEVAETDRGGDITYHGPGQLVAYPILDLNALGLRSHGYLRLLEQVVIDTLDAWGLDGRRDDSATGVWVGSTPGAPASKIAAIGVRLTRWVSLHGLALNVTTDLAHFDLIVPCGLAGRRVTSLHRELGDACPPMRDVKTRLVKAFEQRLRDPAGGPTSPRRRAPPSPRR